MRYYIIAGEASGDLHGSKLIEELKKIDAKAEIRAWGGDKMLNKGAYLVKHYKTHNYMGFTQVILHLPQIIKNLKFCKSDIIKFNPDVVIFIDFPGFNLRICKWAKKKGFKTIYYISPQIWAWKQNRIKTIKKYVDRMIVILPFEKEFYKKFNYYVDFVGHPLCEDIPEINEPQQNNLIALLPGSRPQEIKKMLPIMLEASQSFPEHKFVVAGLSTLNKSIYKSCNKYPNVCVDYDNIDNILKQSTAAIVTSGTATLQTALYNVPLIVCYKTNYLSYLIAKRLIKVKYISLVNLILNEPVVKELIQKNCNKKAIVEELNRIITDNDYANLMKEKFKKIREMLFVEKTSFKVAEIIYNEVNNNSSSYAKC